MTTRTTRLDLRGMSCANCARTRDRVGGIEGASDVDVNYATDEGTVSYDPDRDYRLFGLLR